MTGFGTSRLDNELLTLFVEIKALNSKYLDLGLRLPRNFSVEKELLLRNLIKEKMNRGKVSLTLELQLKQNPPQNSINKTLLKTYYQEIREVAEELQANQSDIFRLAMLMPDVQTQKLDNVEALEEIWQYIQKAVIEAIEKCEKFRQNEGQNLIKAFDKNIKNISHLLEDIKKADPKRNENIKQRLQQKIKEIETHEKFDANRFEQEMIYYLEKLDISEEKVRLASHLEYFLKELKQKQISGKKLNFIAQEIGREINTIGAKANDATIQHLVVLMKDELEQIKEQSLNVL